MIDYNELHRQKDTLARRLRAALYGIRKRNIPRLEQRTFETLAECVLPATAYRTDRDVLLPHGRPLQSLVRHASKKAVIIQEAHRAVVLYWDLVRYDEAVGLGWLIKRLAYYAGYGYGDCELLGGPDSGYSLLVPHVEEK